MIEKSSKTRAIAALVLRIIGFAVGIIAIILHMLVNTVIESGFMVKHNLAYFTLQTNIFCCIIFAVLIWKSVRTFKHYHRYEVTHINHSLHLACTIYISITMLGYWALLMPVTGFPGNPLLLSDAMFLHTFTPILAIADYVIFGEHGGIKKSEIFKWLVYPVLYMLSIVIISFIIKEPYYTFEMGGKVIELMYPYPFFDPQVMGTGGVVILSVAAVLLFLLIGVLCIHIDNGIAKIKNRI